MAFLKKRPRTSDTADQAGVACGWMPPPPPRESNVKLNKPSTVIMGHSSASTFPCESLTLGPGFPLANQPTSPSFSLSFSCQLSHFSCVVMLPALGFVTHCFSFLYSVFSVLFSPAHIRCRICFSFLFFFPFFLPAPIRCSAGVINTSLTGLRLLMCADSNEA